MRRTGKLLYVPGLISLIGILIVLPSFYKKIKPTKQYCLSLFIPRDGEDKYLIDFSKYRLEKELAKRKKLKFILDNNKKENIKKIEVIQHEARKLKYTSDTSTVIFITLSDSITYGDFVSLVDMCEADGHKRYASWDNKFVIWGEWPEKKKIASDFSCFFCNDVIRIKEPNEKQSLFKLMSQKVKKYYTPQGLYLLLGWLVLLISFFFFRKRNSILKTVIK